VRPALRLAARLLYPRAWRDRYGSEFDALIDDTPANYTVLLDVVRGGIAMRVRMSNPVVMVLAQAVAGALIAGVGALTVPAKFEARGMMRVTGDTAAVPAIFTAAVTRAGVSPADISVIRTNNDGGFQVAYANVDPHRARDVVQRVMGQALEKICGKRRLVHAGCCCGCSLPRTSHTSRHAPISHGSPLAGSSVQSSARR